VLRPVLELATRFADALDRVPTGASLVCVPVSEPERVRVALDRERIRAAVRGDGIRFSVHVWNDDADIERAVDAIRPFLRAT
jgi:selenocysteine lyase/cysteine desulfurase